MIATLTKNGLLIAILALPHVATLASAHPDTNFCSELEHNYAKGAAQKTQFWPEATFPGMETRCVPRDLSLFSPKEPQPPQVDTTSPVVGGWFSQFAPMNLQCICIMFVFMFASVAISSVVVYWFTSKILESFSHFVIRVAVLAVCIICSSMMPESSFKKPLIITFCIVAVALLVVILRSYSKSEVLWLRDNHESGAFSGPEDAENPTNSIEMRNLAPSIHSAKLTQSAEWQDLA